MAHEAPAFLGLLLMDPLHPPILHPLPHIAKHVHVAKGSRGVGGDRASAFKAVLGSVGCGELSLPGVGPMFAARLPFVAPRVESVLLARPARRLPLRLRWQSLTRPPATTLDVVEISSLEIIIHKCKQTKTGDRQ